MPYKDPEKQRQYQRHYQKEYNKKRRGGLAKNLANPQTQIETAEDLRVLLQHVVNVVSTSRDELELEAYARILLKAVEVGIKIVEITDLEDRVRALELQPQNQNHYAIAPTNYQT